jgi:hypothetical protein
MEGSTISSGHADTGPDGRACVYTALLGGYEQLTEQPVARESSLDFVCLTDDATLVSETWRVRLVEPLLPHDAVRSQRALKIRAHASVPDYDVSLYIDNSIVLKAPPEVTLTELLPSKTPLALMAHGFRESVADEFRAVVGSGLDAPTDATSSSPITSKPIPGPWTCGRSRAGFCFAAITTPASSPRWTSG